jgi:DHA2 family multidrug resistance protein
MLAIGMAVFAFGLYLNAGLNNQSSFWELLLPQAVRGSSLMLCFLPINALALGTLPPDKLKNASGLYNLMRNLGGAIGLAVLNTVIIERLALHWARLSSHFSATSPVVQNYVDQLSGHLENAIHGDPTRAAYRVVGNLIQRESYVMTLNDCLLLMAGVFAAGLLAMPLVRKPRQTAEGGH